MRSICGANQHAKSQTRHVWHMHCEACGQNHLCRVMRHDEAAAVLQHQLCAGVYVMPHGASTGSTVIHVLPAACIRGVLQLVL